MIDKKVLVIGGGVAGLSAALELAGLGVGVEIVEKADELGGHAGQFVCKATDTCAKCGACIIEEKIKCALSNPNVNIHTGIQLNKIQKQDCFCTDFTDKKGKKHSLMIDAVILASGFQAFEPVNKPYGYGMFDNVITNLELERMLRKNGRIKRPSDQEVPDRLAVIQCVGSRDEKLNHLWCSKVCCGSALRMARLIKSRQPAVEITFFYMDIQTFGKDFQTFYPKVQNDVKMIRAIPGDIYRTEDDRLRVNYFLAGSEKGTEDLFDMVVLSVGIIPGEDNNALAELLDVPLDISGFFARSGEKGNAGDPAIYCAGTTKGPMNIADAVADAGRVAWEVVQYLR